MRAMFRDVFLRTFHNELIENVAPRHLLPH